MDLTSLRDEYESHIDEYKVVEKHARSILESSMERLGVDCKIESRVKDTESFLKKALRLQSSEPMVTIRDKIGLRVVTVCSGDISTVSEELNSLFSVISREDKAISLDPNQLGYLGIHIEAVIGSPTSSIGDAGLIESCYNEVPFEIQLHTIAQSAWASISHRLLYKPDVHPSLEIKRSIFRLVALMEIFDKEVDAARNDIFNSKSAPEFKLLGTLEGAYREFSTVQSDRALSIQLVKTLASLLTEPEIVGFDQLILDFVAENKSKLCNLFDSYRNDNRNAYKKLILSQPEILLVFERLESDKFSLMDAWRDSIFPREFLEFTANVWGVGLPEF